MYINLAYHPCSPRARTLRNLDTLSHPCINFIFSEAEGRVFLPRTRPLTRAPGATAFGRRRPCDRPRPKAERPLIVFSYERKNPPSLAGSLRRRQIAAVLTLDNHAKFWLAQGSRSHHRVP